ncbi:hypothetical protein VOLCADRAFT_89002 [Volvox carteri f. nagariensis]|uniref:Centrosomal protein of 162 kDa n=1 Tax=Volvox carteri f. nagariensis TaxID=3068 RepID=D8TQJ0_VOLCA|nr:uncharacterized protein VOLCADRAFT_89002 [Volvox carteri f. nagariensis]EFJ50161.1 hypothetical protein VOLCADRAFT_89002 [Volvox carteri f. nagariensis]|eukprot:XP_002948781.1 hypothetical protein VOLCADRAFT_89002 [Volvox carteri f. nagariensis]
MTSTQISARYSSAGNSGYDDDFEADADELDAELDFGVQASDDDATGADATDAGNPAAIASHASQPTSNLEATFHPGYPQPVHHDAQQIAPGFNAVPSAVAISLMQQLSSQDVAQQQQQLAAAISQSVEAMRTSEHVRQLQGAVEALTAQLVAAERGRSTAEAALVELTQRMQEQEKRLNETWEAKLLEKQREVQQLRTKVQQLESQGIKELEESLAAAESRTAEEVLRTERAVLLARDDAGRRNAETATKLARVLALEKELEGVREEAQMREAELKAQLEKLRAEKKALEARAGGVDLKAMAEGDVLVKQLREEMDASRQATQALIQEMQAKLAWYAENQELLNKNDALVAEQRETIQQLQARLGIAGLHRCGHACLSHGSLVTLATGICEVTAFCPGAKGSATNRVAAAQARIRELEAQVDQLNKALRSRAPGNSLAAVVAAARPSPEETQLVSELREQVELLESKLKSKDEEFELQLRSYQQQFEKLKTQYSERASRLEAVSKVRGRVKDLERQLEDQKNIFRRRVQELEARLKASRRPPCYLAPIGQRERAAQDNGAAVPPTPAAVVHQYPASALQTPTKGQQQQHQSQTQQAPSSAVARRDDLVPASQLRARELEIKKLTAELERRSKQVSELHLKLGESESRNVRLASDLRRAQQSGVMGQSPLPSRYKSLAVLGMSLSDRLLGIAWRGIRQPNGRRIYVNGT